MSECTHDCSNCSVNCESRTQDFTVQLNAGSSVRRVIGVVSGKGGVGKSLVTGLMAVLLNRRGERSAILDADLTGPSIPRMFGLAEKAKGDSLGIYPVESKTGIPIMSINLLLEDDSEPVIWRGPVLAGTVKQFWTDVIWGKVDTMFVDMPPGTGDVPLTVFQSLPVDGILVVATPQGLVSMIVEKAVHMAQMMNVPIIGLVENMSYLECPDCNKRISLFGESGLDAVALKYGLPVLARLPIDPKVAAMCDRGQIELFNHSWLDAAVDAVEGIK
ncbi:MAG TPA: Mrp/NBP35 family ATP-binding protein [Clostridia bacterium]|nr:Mrp/NBP35 family ATP-binding protein [Clostridia bacterium]